MYGKWTIKKYRVYYSFDLSESYFSNPNEDYYEANSTVRLGDPVMNNHGLRFLGWYIDGSRKSSFVIKSNVFVDDRFSKNSFGPMD